jgi:hypothetical protein
VSLAFRTCLVDGCELGHEAKGMCHRHYARARIGRKRVPRKPTDHPGTTEPWPAPGIERDKMLAYAAGIVDGEGSILITKSRRLGRPDASLRYGPSVIVGMNDPEAVELCGRLFGVPAKKVKQRTIGASVEHKYQFHLQGHERIYWALKELRPYLRVKGAQADRMCRYVEDWRANRENDNDVKMARWYEMVEQARLDLKALKKVYGELSWLRGSSAQPAEAA